MFKGGDCFFPMLLAVMALSGAVTTRWGGLVPATRKAKKKRERASENRQAKFQTRIQMNQNDKCLSHTLFALDNPIGQVLLVLGEKRDQEK
jgi:hypothetical protein